MPLRLKSLELHGYKTFAARTVFEFGEGITAIVGPNGSGKSNIADSLRWVLGEQSYGLLRGKKTEDMIFSGSEQRPRAGMASATVLFDNSDDWLPVDFSEVGLTRRAYRDGHNEYLLNGQQVRLREINELLAQSGLSERTYTIIGQGLVDASLALKADERRRLFEEAAGVGLYRSRREDAVRRLEITQRNLERVLDIMAELEPRLRSLERQARRAQEYGQAQADLRLLLRDWYGYHWHHSQRELADARELLREHEAKLNQARDEYQKHQEEFSTFRNRLQDLRMQLNGWHRELASLHSQRETVSRDLAVLEERRRSLGDARQSIMSEQERAQDEGQLGQERVQEVEQEITRLEADYQEAHNQHIQAVEALRSRQAEHAVIEEKLLAARQKMNSLNAQNAEFLARMDSLETRRTELARKTESTGSALTEAEQAVQQAEEKQRTVEKERVQAEKAHAHARSALEEQQKEVSSLEDDRRKQIEARAARENEETRLKTQLEVLVQAEQSLTGYAEGARFLLEAVRDSRLNKSPGALSAMLDVPAEYEVAIASALGDHLDAVLLDSGEDAEQALRLLENTDAGRATLLPLEWLNKAGPLKAPNDPNCLGVASDLVRAPKELIPAVVLLLGQVLVVKDRATARGLVQGKDQPIKAVTLRGEVFRADGSVVAGGAARSGTLSRPRQRRELQSALDELSERVAGLDAEIERLNKDISAAQRELVKCEQTLVSTREHLEKAQESEQQVVLESESAHRQLEWNKSQIAQLRSEVAEAQSEQKQVEETRVEIENQELQSQETIRALASELASLSTEEAQSQVTYWNTRAAVSERALTDVRSRLVERQQAVVRLGDQQATLKQRLDETDQSLENLDREKETLRQQENTLNEQIETLRVRIDPAEKELAEAERQDVERQERETTAQRALASVERQYTQVQIDLTRRQENLDSLRHKIEDDFGLVMFSYEEDVSGPVPLPFEGMVEQLPVVTELPVELEEQVTQQRALLRRMGAVNPEAKQEYDSERGRFEFMKSQVADLQKAEADLRQVIAELDELTRRDFSLTFEQVAGEFKQIFTRLFGGGSARLVLTDPDNLIDTGIDIEARLPGRREQGLSLLSGGERSLTAIALVFSLLKVSPTPVCVLDEVDAMLDEANVGRFRDLLRELSERTQFVVITHNRNTVQAAEVIYGVTMGRDSASQMISLRLDEISDDLLRGS
jgi:chromosome segregation protein